MNVYHLWEDVQRFIKGTGFYSSHDKTCVRVFNWEPTVDSPSAPANGPDTEAMYQLLLEAGFAASLDTYLFYPDRWVIKIST